MRLVRRELFMLCGPEREVKEMKGKYEYEEDKKEEEEEDVNQQSSSQSTAGELPCPRGLREVVGTGPVSMK